MGSIFYVDRQRRSNMIQEWYDDTVIEKIQPSVEKSSVYTMSP